MDTLIQLLNTGNREQVLTVLEGSLTAGYLRVLGHRDYGDLLETCWYYRLSSVIPTG